MFRLNICLGSYLRLERKDKIPLVTLRKISKGKYSETLEPNRIEFNRISSIEPNRIFSIF